MQPQARLTLKDILENMLNTPKSVRSNRYSRAIKQKEEEFISVNKVRTIIGTIFGGVMILLVLAVWALFRILSTQDITYSAPIKAKSEMTRKEIKALNVMQPVREFKS